MSRSMAPAADVLTYFVLNPRTNLVKIGLTTSLPKRLRDLGTMNGVALRVLGTLIGDQERAYHERFAAWRAHGEWFTLTAELAGTLRTRFGCRITAPRERAPAAPRVSLSDFRADLEARSGSGLRDPDLEALTDYLYGERLEGLTDDDDEAEAARAERDLEDLDADLDPILGIIEEWQTHWIGWMAPAADPTKTARWLDVWLAFWRPRGEQATRRLRYAMLKAADASDGDTIEQLRLRPVLIDRATGMVEELPPDELYSDGAVLLLTSVELGYPIEQSPLAGKYGESISGRPGAAGASEAPPR